MNHRREDARRVSRLKNTQYEHAIQVSNSVVSHRELIIITALNICSYLIHCRDDIDVGEGLKTIGAILYVAITGGLLARIFAGVKIESVFVVKELGLQTTTVYHSNLKSVKFIPWHSINDVVINEAIVMQKVIFYLAALVKVEERSGGESIIPIFINAKPRLSELKKIYANIQLILKE